MTLSVPVSDVNDCNRRQLRLLGEYTGITQNTHQWLYTRVQHKNTFHVHMLNTMQRSFMETPTNRLWFISIMTQLGWFFLMCPWKDNLYQWSLWMYLVSQFYTVFYDVIDDVTLLFSYFSIIHLHHIIQKTHLTWQPTSIYL